MPSSIGFDGVMGSPPPTAADAAADADADAASGAATGAVGAVGVVDNDDDPVGGGAVVGASAALP